MDGELLIKAFEIVTNIKEPLGIIGLALLILFLLYKLVFEEKIFEKFGKTHAFKIVRLLITYVFVLAIVVTIGMIIYKLIVSPPGKMEITKVVVKDDPDKIKEFLIEELGYTPDEAEQNKYKPVVDITVHNDGGRNVFWRDVELVFTNDEPVPRKISTGTMDDPIMRHITDLNNNPLDITRPIEPDSYKRAVILLELEGEKGVYPQQETFTLELIVYPDKGEPIKYKYPLEVVFNSPGTNTDHLDSPDTNTPSLESLGTNNTNSTETIYTITEIDPGKINKYPEGIMFNLSIEELPPDF